MALLLHVRRLLLRPGAGAPARSFYAQQPYLQAKVGVVEVGKGVETHAAKLEEAVGGDLLETRTLRLKKLGVPCKHHAVSRPTFQQFMTYSSAPSDDSNVNGGTSTTRVASDPDTHQDFQPTSKGSGMSLDDIVAKDIKDNPVLIYMKGYPDAPRCGFSALAVKVLQQYGVSISARDILTNMKLKESVKAHTNWPTFPQIFIKREFVGGSDIILNMHQKGELKDLLNNINAQKGDQDSAP